MRRLLLVASLLSAFACTDQGPDPITGTYVLVTINGRTLPFVFDVGDGGATNTITAGSFTLAPDHTYETSYTSTLAIPGSDPATSIVRTEGTWSQHGSTLALRHPSGADAGQAQLGDRRLIIDDFTTWVYEKQ